jgi:hypothetical protein
MITDGNVAVVTPLAVSSEAVAVGSPSTLRVTLPVGGAVPAGGDTTAMVTVTVKGRPAVGLVVEGAVVNEVSLGSEVTTRICDVLDP